MAAPKKKTSRSRTRQRFSTYMTKMQRQMSNRTVVQGCSNCSEKTMPHTVCTACGYYKGKQVLNVKSASDKVQKLSA